MTKKPTGRTRLQTVPFVAPLHDASIFMGGSPRADGDAAEAHHQPVFMGEARSSYARKNGLVGTTRNRKRSSAKRRRKTRSV